MSVGQIGGGVVGGILGALVPGLGPFLGAQIGMTLGGMLNPPKGPTIEGPRLNDLTVQTSTYGATIPRVYGTVALNGNVIWLENNAIKETVRKKKSGGKGGGSKSTTRTYTYSATFAVGLCKGPIVGVRRIWIGKTLFYDAGSTDPDTIAASNAAAVGFRIYLGTDTQQPDARIQATVGVANTPAWRGLAYIVFDDLPLAAYGDSLMGAQVRVEVLTAEDVYTYNGVKYGNVPYHPGPQSPPNWNGTYYVSIPTSSTATGQSLLLSVDGANFISKPLPEIADGYGADWQSCAASPNGTIVIFRNGAVAPSAYRSTDHGDSWTQVGGWSSSCWPYSACWGNGRFVMVGWSQVGVSTDDGQTWSFGPFPKSKTNGNGFFEEVRWCPAAAKFVTPLWDVNANKSFILTSPNGASGSWSFVEIPLSSSWSTVAEFQGKLLVCSHQNDGMMVSVDNGATWNQRSTALGTFPPGRAYAVATDGSGSVLVFMNSSSVYWTYDLVTYYNTSHTSTLQAFNQMCWNGNKWMAMEYTTTSGPGQNICCEKTFLSSGIVTLGSVVSAECLQSGQLTAGDIDVNALISPVRGYVVGSIGAIRAVLEPLQGASPFDVIQSGYKLKFVARGGSSVRTIAADDLDARGDGQAAGVSITQSREMDCQIPKRVTIRHIDWDREYEVGSQYVDRLNTSAVNSPILDLPIVLTADEAIGKAEVLLYTYWMERYDLEFSLPMTYAGLEPSDVITLPLPEGNQEVRLTACDYTSAGQIKCRGKYARSAVYTPASVPSSPSVSGVATIAPPRASVYVLLDLPMIDSSQDAPSFLAAMCGSGNGWPGGALYQSTDGGSNWISVDDFGAPGATLGIASNTIGVVDSRTVDGASVLNVTLTQGSLFSITQQALLNGGNLFAYGSGGRWEIIGVQTVTSGTGNTYALRDLLRGRYGTEWAMGLHQVGDSLVLLDRNEVSLISTSSASIGLSWLYRAVTFGQDISTDSNRSFAYQAVNLKPLAPVFLTGDIDPVTANWSLSWLRRTRVGGEWRDNVDAMLGETSEVYQVDIFTDGTYTAVKRTLSTTSPACSYASADQVIDFGANQATLYLKIYQLSANVGRGYPLTQSLSR